MANFYKSLLGVDNDSDDDVHQFIISDGTTLTIYNDGAERVINSQSICLAFTVEDADAEFEKRNQLGVEIIEPPTVQPWGARNMTFCAPEITKFPSGAFCHRTLSDGWFI